MLLVASVYCVLCQLHWVSTIKEHLGDIMAVIRVQSAFRTFKARKELRRLIDERKKAVKRLMLTRRRSILAAGGAGASILMEGPLKKKNTKSLSRLLVRTPHGEPGRPDMSVAGCPGSRRS